MNKAAECYMIPSSAQNTDNEPRLKLAKNEQAADNVVAWHKYLAGAYNKSAISPEALISWIDILGHCNDKLMMTTVREWAKNEPKMPVPADLLKAYEAKRELTAERTRPMRKYTADGEQLYLCPYCCDTGWFWTYPDNDPYDGYVCACEHDKNAGQLGKAMAADNFVFDFDKGGFVQRKTWIGAENHG